MYEKKIMLAFARVHILHHAGEKRGIYGAWMMEELSGHGYSMGPGTLYPILHDMEKEGLLTSEDVTVSGKVRKVYHLTDDGRKTLGSLKKLIRELYGEVIG